MHIDIDIINKFLKKEQCEINDSMTLKYGKEKSQKVYKFLAWRVGT